MQWRHAAVAFELEKLESTMFAAAMPRSGVDIVLLVTFTILVGMAAGMDLRYRRIPNSLALTIFVVGSGFALLSAGPAEAIPRVLEGCAAGLVMWFPFWALGMLGAGDVKFFAAAAAWLGPRLALQATLLSALLGGLIALLWLLPRARLATSRTAPEGASDEREEVGLGRDASKGSNSLPYGVAMAAGLVITAWFPQLIHL